MGRTGKKRKFTRKKLHDEVERMRILEGVVQLRYPGRSRRGEEIAFGEDVRELFICCVAYVARVARGCMR